MARTQTELKKYLQYGEFLDPEAPIDESGLTDEELQNRLQGYQELGQSKGEIDPAGLMRDLQTKLSAFKITNPEQVASAIANFTMSQGRYPNSREIQALGTTKINPADRENLRNFANDQSISNDFIGRITNQTNAPNVGTDVKRLQDLVEGRTQRAASQKDLEGFINEIPGQLSQNTEQFFQGQREQGKRTLEDFMNPQIRGNLAARGLLTSGDLDAELANATGEILNPIEQQYSQSRADDLAFFENAAYQTNLQKTIDANQNLASQINFERGNALNAQSNRFQVGQKNIQDSASMALFRRQQQANLTGQQTRLRQQSDLQNSQNRAGMMGGIGRSIGSIGGAVIGNALVPGIGGIVGGQAIGGEFGGGVGTLLSKTA